KPIRLQVTHSKHAYDHWWQYERSRPELYGEIGDLRQVVVIARVSKTVIPVRVPTGQVMSEQVVVFPTSSAAQLACLSSSVHYWWALKYSGDMRGDLRYAPSDVHETLPRPDETPRVTAAGQALERLQQAAMKTRDVGLTALYNSVHTSSEEATDIEAIRQAHVEVDQAAAEAYGWTDLDLKHGFHSTPQGVRFTIAPDVQTEVLDRLLELNHVRYKEEVEKGLHTPEAKRRRAAARKAKAKARAAARNSSTATTEGFDDGALFADPNALF